MTSTSRFGGTALGGTVGILLLFLLLPVLIVVLTSFTTQGFPAIPTDGFSLQWYADLLNDRKLLTALDVSFLVAFVSALLSVTIGTMTAFGFVRGSFPYKEQISTVMLLPMIISPVITGIALIRYFGVMSIDSGLPALILGHTILTLPYVFLLVRSELQTFDQDLEHASRVLGGDPIVTFMNVTVPVISPAILSGFFVAFVVSFGEFTASQFFISPGASTVPVEIYTMLRTGLSPSINALATILVVIMLGAIAASSYFSR